MLHYFAINDIHAKFSSVVSFSDSVLKPIFAVTSDTHFYAKGLHIGNAVARLTLALAKLSCFLLFSPQTMQHAFIQDFYNVAVN